VDHIVVLGEMHLRRVLKSYAKYYNETRTHRSLDKDAPISRPVQWDGSIMSHARKHRASLAHRLRGTKAGDGFVQSLPVLVGERGLDQGI
jgi:hypothetical protein